MSVTARCKRESRNLSHAITMQARWYSAHMLITVFTESDPVLSSLASAMFMILRRMPCVRLKFIERFLNVGDPASLRRMGISCNRNNVFERRDYPFS